MERKHIITAAVLLLLLAGVGWALFSGEDAQLVEAKQIRDQMLQKMDTMSDEERRAQRDLLREKTQDFSSEQRREFGNGFRNFFMQRVDAVLAMPREQQTQELDKWIDRMEEMRKSREAGDGGGRGPGGEGRGGEGRPQMSSAQRDQRRKERLDRSTPQMRAKMDAMRDLMNERREQRGLEPMSGGGRGMFGPPRGGPR